MTSIIHQYILPAAHEVLPPEMLNVRSDALLLAIGLQESRFLHRLQVKGPARGFWQFERAGVQGVLKHPRTAEAAQYAMYKLRLSPPTPELLNEFVYHVIAFNDVLACCIARLCLWTLPHELPDSAHSVNAWAQYLEAWRPGKPHLATWDANYKDAWALVSGKS